MSSPIWKPVKGYEESYKVSNSGIVRSLDREVKHGSGSQRLIRGLALNQVVEIGYCRVRLYKNSKGRQFFVHRLVAEAFLDNPNEYPVVNHIDYDGLNNNSNNLEWCTQSHNVKHSYK